MSKDIWGTVSKYFKKKEFTYPDKMDEFCLYLAFLIRHETKCQMVIHSSNAEYGHAINSYHYKGMAIDFHLEGRRFKHAVEDVEDILKEHWLSNFVGLGLYPYWNSPGFHIDSRGYKARWSLNENGVYVSYEQGKIMANYV